MKKDSLLTVILSCMLILNLGEVNCIIGGTISPIVPHQVAINSANNVFCSGTIINQNHVVTAASCVFDSEVRLVASNQVTIRAGVVLLADNVPRINVIAIFPHPTFNPFTNQNNVAVLRTATNFVFQPNIAQPAIATVNMAEHVIADGIVCRIAGWNPTTAVPIATINFLDVPILNRDSACNLATVHNGRVFESMLCAGSNAINSGVCINNQGAGLICNNLFVGILTGGFGCGNPNSPGIYTQVRMHREWINQQLTRNNIPQAGPTPQPGLPGPANPVNDDSSSVKIFSSIFLLMSSIIISLLGVLKA